MFVAVHLNGCKNTRRHLVFTLWENFSHKIKKGVVYIPWLIFSSVYALQCLLKRGNKLCLRLCLYYRFSTYVVVVVETVLITLPSFPVINLYDVITRRNIDSSQERYRQNRIAILLWCCCKLVSFAFLMQVFISTEHYSNLLYFSGHFKDVIISRRSSLV